MNKGTVLNLKCLNSFFIFVKKNWCLMLLTSMFLIGLIFGTFNFNKSINLEEFFKNITAKILDIKLEQSFIKIFFTSLFFGLLFLFINFAFGTSLIGVTVIPILILAFGIMFGGISGSIISEYALKGIAINSILIVPPTIIFVIFLIIGARNSIRFSILITKTTLPGFTPKNLSFAFAKYCKQYLLLFIPLIISALLDAWLSTKIISLIKL